MSYTKENGSIAAKQREPPPPLFPLHDMHYTNKPASLPIGNLNEGDTELSPGDTVTDLLPTQSQARQDK